MKKLSLVMALLINCLSFSFGQTPTDSITVTKVFGGYQFYQADKRLSMSQLDKSMEPNERAYKEMKTAQSSYTLSSILGGAGGFMVGWPLGTAVAGGEPNWVLAGIGAGLILVAIPISRKFNRQAKSAIDTYNGGLKASSVWDKTELEFAMSGTGVGFTLKF